MAYSTYYSQGYANGSAGATPITAAALNHAEAGITAAAATADAAVPAPASPPTSGVVYWTGTGWSSAKVTDANVDAAAAISYSKLALAGSIINNDISGSAAIAASKLAGYPSDASKTLAGDGSWKPLSAVTFRKTTSQAATNTVTETDLLNGEFTLGAGLLGSTGTLRLKMWGDFKGNSGAAQAAPRFKLKLGATPTVVFDTSTIASVMANSATRLGWYVEVLVMNSATNVQWCNIDGRIYGPMATAGQTAFATGEGAYTVGGVGGVTASVAFFGGGNAAAIDTTASMAVLFTVVNGSATTTETKLLGAVAEVL